MIDSSTSESRVFECRIRACSECFLLTLSGGGRRAFFELEDILLRDLRTPPRRVGLPRFSFFHDSLLHLFTQRQDGIEEALRFLFL